MFRVYISAGYKARRMIFISPPFVVVTASAA
jgi:hypothetical protein